jgi:uncharacterized protein
MSMSHIPWYVAGLHFECTGCGACCAGPEEGFIWVTKPEQTFIADLLKLPVDQLRRKYMRREGLRTTIIEEPCTKDCIFLEGGKRCRIYSVRPNQCRTWPFWASNLGSPNAWNEAAQGCPGINRGPLFTREEIDTLKKQKCWWADERHPDHLRTRR